LVQVVVRDFDIPESSFFKGQAHAASNDGLQISELDIDAINDRPMMWLIMCLSTMRLR